MGLFPFPWFAGSCFYRPYLFETDEARELAWVLQYLRMLMMIVPSSVPSQLVCSVKKLQTFSIGSTILNYGMIGSGKFSEFRMVWRDQRDLYRTAKLFRETGAISQNLSRPDGERRVTNFLHLAEVLHQVTSENLCHRPLW